MNEYLAAEQSRNKSMIPYSLTQGISFSGSQSASTSEFLIQMIFTIVVSYCTSLKNMFPLAL